MPRGGNAAQPSFASQQGRPRSGRGAGRWRSVGGRDFPCLTSRLRQDLFALRRVRGSGSVAHGAAPPPPPLRLKLAGSPSGRTKREGSRCLKLKVFPLGSAARPGCHLVPLAVGRSTAPCQHHEGSIKPWLPAEAPLRPCHLHSCPCVGTVPRVPTIWGKPMAG